MTIHYGITDSPLGNLIAASTEKGVCFVMMDDNKKSLVKELGKRFPKAELIDGGKSYEATLMQVVDMIHRPAVVRPLELDVQGTAFQKSVWNALQKVPVGKTATYRDIAKSIRKPKAVRAVAQACGANNIAIVIPCHRIIKSDGSISGYRWGVHRKKELLEREAAL